MSAALCVERMFAGDREVQMQVIYNGRTVRSLREAAVFCYLFSFIHLSFVNKTCVVITSCNYLYCNLMVNPDIYSDFTYICTHTDIVEMHIGPES